MKKTFRTVALFGMLCMATVSCTKENITNTEMSVNTDTVHYYAGSYYGSENLYDDGAWDAFLDRMLSLARDGYEVTLVNSASSNGQATKEVVTYTTTSSDDAKRWSKEMYDQGYNVTISYDKTTGIYTCVAVK